ncbi:hypothetical protein A9R16_014685 [Acidiferrobacter thiooxydans]|uniref:hypothetical protein n=1 Tax=Acidiferrobacter thiooxydans TaxID=163359 RepID=UPI00082651EC|nr:hypothetical protein [Acidiferrobacter thiooxydans]UEN99648.1 hypothetical protein A9R16_014685 [Acidiferrobacter thiooxydans]
MGRHTRATRPRGRAAEAAVRQKIVIEAARIMAEDGVRDYQTAKRKAAHRLNLPEDKNWPGNAEIEAALKQHLELFQKDSRAVVRELRAHALEAMTLLRDFSPKLVGEVLSGAITRFPEVQLHLAAPAPEDLGLFLDGHGIPYVMEERRLRYNDARTALVPVFRFVAGETGFALYVLSLEAIRELPVSPIDGRPMHRAGIRELEELLGS